MDQKKEGRMLIRISAILLTVFALIYLLLGIIATVAEVEGLGAVHGSGETLVLVLAYGTAIMALGAAFVGFRTAKESMDAGICKILGVVITVLSLISVIYIQIAQGKFELFDILVMVCGIFYIMGAKKVQ